MSDSNNLSSSNGNWGGNGEDQLNNDGQQDNIRIPIEATSNNGQDNLRVLAEAIDNLPTVLTDESTNKHMAMFLRRHHFQPSVISAIPEDFGPFIFARLEKEDLAEFSQDTGVRMLLRVAQKAVREALEKPVVPPLNPVNVQNPVLPVVPASEPVTSSVTSKDNMDPYLISDDFNNPTGMSEVYALYGKQEGGVGSKYARLPSLKSGSAPAKGLYAMILYDLGAVLVTSCKENMTARASFWHSALLFLHNENWSSLGPDQWGLDVSFLMSLVYKGMSLEEANRSPTQKNCVHMYGFQDAPIMSKPKLFYRLMMGSFEAGPEGIQLQSFEPKIGMSRALEEDADIFGRNRGIIQTLSCMVAFIRTFIHRNFADVFFPIQEALRTSDSLQRTKSAVLWKFFNTHFSVVFIALPKAAFVATIASTEPVSLRGIGAINAALLGISNALVPILQSKAKMKAMEDEVLGKLTEEKARIKLIDELGKTGDLSLISPLKKRGRDEEDLDSVNKKEAKRVKDRAGDKERKARAKARKVEVANAASPSGTSPKVKQEPTVPGSSPSPAKRDFPCMYHLCTKLSLKDPNGVVYKCPRGVTQCSYKHSPLNAVFRAKAEHTASKCTDAHMKAMLTSAITAYTGFL